MIYLLKAGTFLAFLVLVVVIGLGSYYKVPVELPVRSGETVFCKVLLELLIL